MNVEQMKAVIKEIIARTDLTPCVVGHRGVGKSAGIIQACREDEGRLREVVECVRRVNPKLYQLQEMTGDL